MRVFFVVKVIQIINCCVTVALLLGAYRLCGKTAMDRVLSRPGSSCMQFIQNSFPMKILSLSKSNYSRQYRNEMVISTEHLENKTVEVSNSSTNNSVNGEATIPSENYESYSCITLNFKDPNCFSSRNLKNKPACKTVFGLTLPIFIVILDFIYLVYTVISISYSIAPPYQQADFSRCAIHILFWCITSFSTMCLLYTWEHIWKYSDFKPKVSKQLFMAVIIQKRLSRRTIPLSVLNARHVLL
ncbi:unnamed protein product [Litomosoides sigmodontis]|uniref:Uncharacterized protein n=1 Tax=Litomosoides sigmodontis TaxID=42156 RepID=A0A3P6VB18_LITSI|nr:unnamed protein product [Litomosoides sigmodontis]